MNPNRRVRVASYAFRPGDTLSEAARKIIAKQAARVRAHAPGTRGGRDPEALHDMRVATRRLRFALRLFAPWMPPGRADHLRADLRRVALVLGRVRDLDVFMENLPALMDRSGLEPDARKTILSALSRKRAQGRAVLVRMLLGNRFVGLVLILERAPMGPSPGGLARKEAHRMLRSAARKLRSWGRKADLNRPPDLHRLRILFKRLRYTCEYFNDLYGGAFDGAIARFVRFQDCLGKYQDAVVASVILERLAKGLNSQLADRSSQLSGGEILSGHRVPPSGPSVGVVDRRSQILVRSKSTDKNSLDTSDAVAKLQQLLREQRGLQREALSELWPDFALILRAFLKLLRLEQHLSPVARPSVTSGAPGR